MKLIDLDADKEYLLDGRYKVEPIVHCQDCQYYREIIKGQGECDINTDHSVSNDDFCSFAERKGQENEITERSNYTL